MTSDAPPGSTSTPKVPAATSVDAPVTGVISRSPSTAVTKYRPFATASVGSGKTSKPDAIVMTAPDKTSTCSSVPSVGNNPLRPSNTTRPGPTIARSTIDGVPGGSGPVIGVTVVSDESIPQTPSHAPGGSPS